MKFNFKIQQYQTDAVDAVIKVFHGQGYHDKLSHIRDMGKVKPANQQMQLGLSVEQLEILDPTNDTGYRNEAIALKDEQLLENIQTLQSENNIKRSSSLTLWKQINHKYAYTATFDSDGLISKATDHIWNILQR